VIPDAVEMLRKRLEQPAGEAAAAIGGHGANVRDIAEAVGIGGPGDVVLLLDPTGGEADELAPPWASAISNAPLAAVWRPSRAR